MADLRPQERGQAAQAQTSRQRRRQEGIRRVNCKPRDDSKPPPRCGQTQNCQGRNAHRHYGVQPHFTDGETEAQRREETLRSPSESLAELKWTLLCLSINKANQPRGRWRLVLHTTELTC